MLTKALCLGLIFGSFTATSFAQDLPPDVLVRQDGVDVRFDDVDRFAETIPEKDRAGFFDSPKRIEQVLQSLLTQKLVARDVRERQSDPILINQAAQMSDEALYKQEIERIRDAANIPDMTALAEETYAANRERYVEPGRIDVRYILLRSELERERGKPKAESVAAAREVADRLLRRINGSPESFDSITPETADAGAVGVEIGDLQDAGSDRYPDAVQAAARALREPGAISPAVEAVSGFYILKLVSRVPDRQLSLAEVKESIVEQKRRDFARREIDEYVGGLRKTPLQANPEALGALRDRYASASVDS